MSRALPLPKRETDRRRARPGPLHAVFRLLTSVRFALALIGVIVATALAGLAMPQVPAAVRERPAMRDAWLDDQRSRFGPLTDTLDRLQLFDIFHSVWFLTLMGLLVVSIAVCSWSRFRPVWRVVFRPRRRVNDRYFETAHHRAHVANAPDAEAVVQALRRRRYRVEVVEQGEVTRLYADRFRWAHFGTFASHLSLLIFLIGGLMTWQMTVQREIVVAEGGTAPLFAVTDADHMQVSLHEFVREQDEAGRDIDYRASLTVSRRGAVVAEDTVTVNEPLRSGGYAFHLMSFAEDGVALTVREAGRDGVLLSDTFQLADRLVLPHVTVRDAAGATVFDGVVPAAFFLPDGTAGSRLALPDLQRPLVLGLQQPEGGDMAAWRLAVSGGGGVDDVGLGERLTVGGYAVTFTEVTVADYAVLSGIPGLSQGSTTFAQSYRQPGGHRELALVGDTGEVVVLAPGETGQLNGHEYTFDGPRTFAGIVARKDPGASFIWVGAVLLLSGLLVTFYVPRRHLWVRIGPNGLHMAGTAVRNADYTEELRALATETERATEQRRAASTQ